MPHIFWNFIKQTMFFYFTMLYILLCHEENIFLTHSKLMDMFEIHTQCFLSTQETSMNTQSITKIPFLIISCKRDS